MVAVVMVQEHVRAVAVHHMRVDARLALRWASWRGIRHDATPLGFVARFSLQFLVMLLDEQGAGRLGGAVHDIGGVWIAVCEVSWALVVWGYN